MPSGCGFLCLLLSVLNVDVQSPDGPTASCLVRQPDDDRLAYDLVAGATETEQVHEVPPRDIGQIEPTTEGVEEERRPRSNRTGQIGPGGPIDDAFPSTTCRGMLGARARRPLSHEAIMRRAHHSVEAEPSPASDAVRPHPDTQRRSPTPRRAGPFARLEAAPAESNAVGARSSSLGLTRSKDCAPCAAENDGPADTTKKTTNNQVRPLPGQCLILTALSCLSPLNTLVPPSWQPELQQQLVC